MGNVTVAGLNWRCRGWMFQCESFDTEVHSPQWKSKPTAAWSLPAPGKNVAIRMPISCLGRSRDSGPDEVTGFRLTRHVSGMGQAVRLESPDRVKSSLNTEVCFASSSSGSLPFMRLSRDHFCLAVGCFLPPPRSLAAFPGSLAAHPSWIIAASLP